MFHCFRVLNGISPFLTNKTQKLRSFRIKRHTHIFRLIQNKNSYASQPLSTPLSRTINNSFKHNIFPSNAKVACFKPLDKTTENKHSISSLRPISIVNTFTKIYEKFSKDLLVSKKEIFLSPF